jgi:DNA (cytosine-5)-methyltransferase 1
MMPKPKPIAMDLYHGCGGLTTGLKQAGFRVIAAIDIDPVSAETYHMNHPEVRIYTEDIRKIDAHQFAEEQGFKVGELDLLAGCPPCQGFSSLRTFNGALVIDDPRNDLLFEFLRFVKVLKPKAVMLENVPGLARDKRFVVFLEQMEQMGYIGEKSILNAEDYSVPQRRRRLLYLAGKGFAIPFAKKARRKRNVRHAIGDLPKPGNSGDPLHDIKEKRSPTVLERIAMIPPNGGSRASLPDHLQLRCHKKTNGFKDVYGRMAWDDVAPTITSGCSNPSKGRFLHPEQNRAITLREAALLQGFSRDYKFPTDKSKSEIALMIGNALPPPFVKAHALSIKHALITNDI